MYKFHCIQDFLKSHLRYLFPFLAQAIYNINYIIYFIEESYFETNISLKIMKA